MTIHKAAPTSDDLWNCETCGQRIKRVPGGHGPIWVHSDSGAVVAPDPRRVDGLDANDLDPVETPDVDVDTMAGWEHDASTLDAIAQLLRDTDWRAVLFDGDALDGIAELVRASGRDPGPDQDRTDDGP